MRAIRSMVLAMLLGGTVAACVTVGLSTRTFGVDSIDELQVEMAYNNAYSAGMAAFHTQLQLFAPSGENPGVCNAGGSKQGCYDADTKAISALQQLISALEAVPVPPRFTIADAHLRAALADDIRGLELRNRAIRDNDNAAWAEHKTVLEASAQALQQAYQQYPADNRPLPAP